MFPAQIDDAVINAMPDTICLDPDHICVPDHIRAGDHIAIESNIREFRLDLTQTAIVTTESHDPAFGMLREGHFDSSLWFRNFRL